MNIFFRELKRNIKSFIIWTASMVSLNALLILFYPTIAEQSKQFEAILKAYPKALLAAFNMNRLSFSNILGYYGTEAYTFIMLFGSIYAMILASSILSKEESEKTIEFLLSKPITRSDVVTEKFLCTGLYIFLFDLIFSLTNYMFFEIVKKSSYDMKAFLLVSAGPLLAHLTFAAIGFLISTFVVKAKTTMSISLGVVLGSYFLSIASGLTDKLENLRYLTPFKYVDAADLILNKRIDSIYMWIMFIVIVVSISAAYIIYNRKDIIA